MPLLFYLEIQTGENEMLIQTASGRFNLRPLLTDDVEQINECVRDPRIYRSVGKIPPNQTIENTKKFILDCQSKTEKRESYTFAIVEDTRIVGCVSASKFEDNLFLDVGYWIAPKFWGRGIATKAVSTFVNWLHVAEKIKFVTAGYFVDNPASGRVLRKCGFLACGRSKYYCLGRSATVECIDMAYCI